MSIYANSNVIEAVSTVLSNGRVGRGSSAPLNVNFIVVGGGAAGTTNSAAAGNASYAGGGGGALVSGSITLGLATDYSVVVGQSGSVTSYPNTSTGGSSSFSGINPSGGNYSYAIGGGIGTTSGGGKIAGTGDGAGAAVYGGGGGGFKTNGFNAVNPNAGNGGSGSVWIINGEVASSFGGGGGGGLQQLAGGAGANGTDGGGRGAGMTNSSTPGTRGSGGGGGAAGNNNAYPASAGGCGSVVFAYPTPASTATGISYGLGGTVTSASYGGVDYTIHTFYENGTFSTRVR
jgi:hypothetical protein